MKINVNSIEQIEPQYEVRQPFTLNISVDLNEGQIQKLFYQIWDIVGDERFKIYLQQEGKTFIELEDMSVAAKDA